MSPHCYVCGGTDEIMPFTLCSMNSYGGLGLLNHCRTCVSNRKSVYYTVTYHKNEDETRNVDPVTVDSCVTSPAQGDSKLA